MQVGSATTTTSLQNNTTTQSTSDAAKTNTVDYNSFLKLLIAQLKNQDPTSPSDPAQWISQLASFSGVEQAVQTNTKLDALMTSMALSQADSIIGRTVTSAEGDVSGKVSSVRIISGGAVAVLQDGSEVTLGAGVKVS